MEVQLSTENIWVNIFVPIIIGPIFLMVKVLYDRWDFKKKESAILSNKLNLEKINNKLQKFYWPIYILLLRDFNLWSNLKIKEEDDIEITCSDSDSDCEGYNFDTCPKCNYFKKTVDGLVIQCRNPVAKNCVINKQSYCIKHFNFENNKLLKIINPDFSGKSFKLDLKPTLYYVPIKIVNLFVSYFYKKNDEI